MENKNYTAIIAVAKPKHYVFNAIKEVTKWWNSEDFKGNSSKQNDEFIISHPGQHYSKQRLIELLPDEKIVWLVTESRLNWLTRNQEEWTNTKMIFNLTTENDKTVLHFTHEGLDPTKECYAMCEKGWTMIIKNWLAYYITVGAPSPEMSKAAEIRNSLLEK